MQKNSCIQRDLVELIRQQSEIFRTGLMHRNLTDIKSVLLAVNQSQLDWIRDLYDAFELAGINTQSTNGPKGILHCLLIVHFLCCTTEKKAQYSVLRLVFIHNLVNAEHVELTFPG